MSNLLPCYFARDRHSICFSLCNTVHPHGRHSAGSDRHVTHMMRVCTYAILIHLQYWFICNIDSLMSGADIFACDVSFSCANMHWCKCKASHVAARFTNLPFWHTHSKQHPMTADHAMAVHEVPLQPSQSIKGTITIWSLGSQPNLVSVHNARSQHALD